MIKVNTLFQHFVLASLLLFAAISNTQATEVVTYYANDALGSPILATDEAGNVLWQEQYAPYGERLVKASASANDS